MTQRRRNIVFGVLFAAAVGAACLCLVRIEAKSRQQVLNNALCDAVIMQRTAAVTDLLRHGADPNQKDSHGQTPRDTDANGEDEIYWMLKEAEQKKIMP